MNDLKTQLAALISVWRGTANDCKLTGDPTMATTAEALENCADEAEKLITDISPS